MPRCVITARDGRLVTVVKATIWHNPNCSKSRETLAILEETPGLEIEVIQYLRNPPSAEKLEQLYRDAKMAAREGLRLTGTDAKERGLTCCCRWWRRAART